MSTESETKSAGVPAGATHVCVAHGSYWRRASPAMFERVGPANCPADCYEIAPIAEAGPAPTTAAPAEQPATECPDHWHCDPATAAHVCKANRNEPCPTCHAAPAEQPGKAADPRPAQPQAPAEPTQKQIEKARAFIRHHNDATCVDACAAELARLLAAEAAPLREERDRLARVLEAMRRERNGAQSQRDQERARAETAEKAVAARDARIATLVDAVTKAADTFKDLGFVFRMLRNPKAEEACNLAEKHTRAALGAPEGQPPAAQQELLGKEGALQALQDIRNACARVGIDRSEGDAAAYAEERATRALADAGYDATAGTLHRIDGSAPPRKAPQWRSSRCDYSLRTLLQVALDHVALESHLLRADMLEAIEVFAPAPSSPEEQLSGKELK